MTSCWTYTGSEFGFRGWRAPGGRPSLPRLGPHTPQGLRHAFPGLGWCPLCLAADPSCLRGRWPVPLMQHARAHTLARLPLCCETSDTLGSWAPAPPRCPNICKIHHTRTHTRSARRACCSRWPPAATRDPQAPVHRLPGHDVRLCVWILHRLPARQARRRVSCGPRRPVSHLGPPTTHHPGSSRPVSARAPLEPADPRSPRLPLRPSSSACRQKGREKSLWVAILPVSYSIFSALLGTQSVLFSKSLSVLLRSTFSGDSQVRAVHAARAAGSGALGSVLAVPVLAGLASSAAVCVCLRARAAAAGQLVHLGDAAVLHHHGGLLGHPPQQGEVSCPSFGASPAPSSWSRPFTAPNARLHRLARPLRRTLRRACGSSRP